MRICGSTSCSRRIGALLGAVAVTACSTEPRPIVPRDSATTALYDSIGAYDVVPLGSSPTGQPVVAVDLNDSGVVVGYFGNPAQYAGDLSAKGTPFRWRSGTFEELGTGSATAGAARAVNELGDVVGNATFAAIWPAGSTVPVPLFPEGSAERNAEPVDINRNRDVLARFDVLHSLVVNATTGEVRVRGTHISPGVVGPEGELLGQYRNSLYPPAVRLRPGAQFFDCTWGGHGYSHPSAINDSSIALVFQSNNVGTPYSSSFVYDTRVGCYSNIALDAGHSANETGDLRSISNANWLAGTIKGLESVMILHKKGFAVLDSVLMASGPQSSQWRVTTVVRVNTAGTFLVRARGPSGADVPALLVRRPR
jgi:hypothetical protein